MPDDTLADKVRRGFAASREIQKIIGDDAWRVACANKRIVIDSTVHPGCYYYVKMESVAYGVERFERSADGGHKRIGYVNGDHEHLRTLSPKEAALWWVQQIQGDEAALLADEERRRREQAERWAAMVHEVNVDHVARYVATPEVQAKAESTLRSYLTDAQWESYVAYGCVPQRSSHRPNRVYVISYAHSVSRYNSARYKGQRPDDAWFVPIPDTKDARTKRNSHLNTYVYEGDVQVDQICIQTDAQAEALPVADQVLALVLLLQSDEERFIQTGNRYHQTDAALKSAMRLYEEEQHL